MHCIKTAKVIIILFPRPNPYYFSFFCGRPVLPNSLGNPLCGRKIFLPHVYVTPLCGGVTWGRKILRLSTEIVVYLGNGTSCYVAMER